MAHGGRDRGSHGVPLSDAVSMILGVSLPIDGGFPAGDPLVDSQSFAIRTVERASSFWTPASPDNASARPILIGLKLGLVGERWFSHALAIAPKRSVFTRVLKAKCLAAIQKLSGVLGQSPASALLVRHRASHPSVAPAAQYCRAPPQALPPVHPWPHPPPPPVSRLSLRSV